jgi:hypothetical protein
MQPDRAAPRTATERSKAAGRQQMSGMNGQACHFRADDILTNDITSAVANAIGFVMEARHASTADAPTERSRSFSHRQSLTTRWVHIRLFEAQGLFSPLDAPCERSPRNPTPPRKKTPAALPTRRASCLPTLRKIAECICGFQITRAVTESNAAALALCAVMN